MEIQEETIVCCPIPLKLNTLEEVKPATTKPFELAKEKLVKFFQIRKKKKKKKKLIMF